MLRLSRALTAACVESIILMLQSPEMSSRRREITAAFALCLAPLIYFLPATLGQIVLCPDDGVLINLPIRAAAAQMITHGILPLWDPYIFGGMPLLGASQAGIFFPPNWLFLIFSPQTAINAEMILAYIVAGVGAFCYARRTGATPAGAFITGFVFEFAGFIVAPTGHMGSIQAAGLLPWILWSIDGYGMTGKRSRAVVIALLVAIQLFAGHPQTFVYSIFLAGAYAVVMAFRKGGVNRAYLYSLLMIGVGMALTAVQLLPTFELTQQSYRQAIDYEFFSGYSLPPSSLLHFFAPYLSGGGDGRFFQLPYTGLPYYGEYIGYVGVLTLLLAIAAPLLKRDRLTVFWCAVAVVCLTLALGRFLPFEMYRLVQYIPGLGLFRVPARHLMEVDLALAVLAGRAVTVITSVEGLRNRRLTYIGIGGFIVTACIVAVGSGAAFGSENILTALRSPEYLCPLVAASAAAVVLWLFARGFRHASALAIVLLILDLSLWGQFSGWRSSPKPGGENFVEPPAIVFLKQQQAVRPPFRVLTLFPPADSFYPSLQHDHYMLYGLQNAAGYDAFALQRYSNFTGGIKEWGELIDPSRQLSEDKVLDLLNVQYLIAKRTSDGRMHSGTNSIDENTLSEHWRLAALFGDVAVYENTHPQPRAWLATQAVVIADESEMLKTIRSGKLPDGNAWNVSRTALLAAPAHIGNVDVESGPGSAEVTSYEPDHIALRTNSTVPSMLVLAENDYPGWRATVDGREEEILEVNYYQRGVELAAGAHEVEFYYRPLSFRAGMILSLITLVGLGLWWAIGGRSGADGDDG